MPNCQPGLKTPARMGPASVFKPRFYDKRPRGMLQLQFPPPTHDGSSQIKSIPHFFGSSPNSALPSSAQPRRKLVKQFVESAWSIMSSGRVGWAKASRQTGLHIPRVLGTAQNPTSGSGHLQRAVRSGSHLQADRFTYSSTSSPHHPAVHEHAAPPGTQPGVQHGLSHPEIRDFNPLHSHNINPTSAISGRNRTVA